MKRASQNSRIMTRRSVSPSIGFPSMGSIAKTFLVPFSIWIFLHAALGQSDQTNNRFVFGDVNDSGNLSFVVPLGSYKGRGLDLPVSLNYSSEVWKIEHLGTVQRTIPGYSGWIRQSVTEATYAKDSRAGWRTGLDLPVIEWPKGSATYDHQGKQGGGAGTCIFRVREVYIHMPNGSTHTLRKHDQPSNGSPSGIDRNGTFYAVDGSRMRFDANGTLDTGTIYMPDGTRYVLGHPTSSIRDRHGNFLLYDESFRQWTDTLGRVINNPLPAIPSVGDFSYSLPGLAGVNGGVQTYTLKWRNLADVLTPDGTGNQPPLKVVGSEFLPYPYSAPSGSNFPASQGSQYQPLFKSSFIYAYGENGPLVGTLIVGHEQPGNAPFNPVVLSEIVLPDGTSYKFSYNVYGEIDKIIHPTNAYDRYEYYGPAPANGPPEPSEEPDPQPYIQALRSLSSKKQSVDGSDSDIREWKYSFYKDLDGYTGSTIIAPDKTRTVTQNYGPGPKSPAYTGSPSNPTLVMVFPFGFRDSRLGMPLVKKFYSSSPDGLGGELLRQEVYQYEQTTVSYPIVCDQSPDQPSGNINRSQPLSRTPRLTRKTDFVFEGIGPALSMSATFQYDLTFQFSTGIDQTQAANYEYVVVANQTAKDTDTPEELPQIPLGTLARYSETTYRNDLIYQGQNILGVAGVARIKSSSGATVSQSEMVYDECPQYCVTAGRALATSMRTWDSSKGPDPDNSNYQLVTHAKFDQYGNRIEATDAKGATMRTVYDATYQALPVQTVTTAPDPYPSQNPDGLPHGSQTGFTTTMTYDTPAPNMPPIGLVVATTDLNGQTTVIEYNDPLLRPTRVIAPNGHQTITEYGIGTTQAARFVKVRAQIDGEKWSESVAKYDGLGRTYLSEKIDSQGNVFTETEYDVMGRVKRSTNPYKSGETRQWSTTEYDDLGRTKKVISPDTDDVQILYGLSTSGVIGATKTIVDQAGRERTGITDALGNMIRVYEGPVPQNLFTDYVFDALGNLRRTIQGEQSRYFMCDSLGRVLFAKQPEQNTNNAFAATDPVTNNSAWSVRYSYDDNGNILTTTDARNISITGTYDRLNRIITRDYSDSTPDVSFFYDGTGLGSVPNFSRGKATKVASTVSESRNTDFDQMGRLLASEQRTTAEQLAGTQAPYAFKYAYNLSGALIEETYPSGRVVRNTLNADGELSQIRSKKNASAGFFTYADSIAYNTAGSVTQLQLGNGHWETAEYDAKRLQITKIGLGLTNVDQNLLRLEFQYSSDGQADNNGAMRLQRMIVPAAGGAPAFTATQSYFYDSLNRLSSSVETVLGNQTWKQSFAYDRYGNRRFDPAGTTTLGSCQQAICNPAVSTANNRLAPGQNYVYDAAGSVTQDANGQRFGYDAEGRQKEFYSASNPSTLPDATYYYDGDGRRVKTVIGTEVTIFAYDASGQLAAEYSTTVAPAQEAKVSFLTADHLGSPRIITDQYGRVSSRKDFTAFGEEIVTPQRVGGPNGNGYDPPGVRQDYTGYQKERESGLEFAQARYYNTGHGRFTTVDPLTASATIRNPQTFNRYSYVINNPYKFVDPLGLALIDIGIEQTSDPYLARYLENNSTYRLQQSLRQSQQNTQTQTQTQVQTQVAVPQALKDVAALNPRPVTSDETGEYAGIMTLTTEEVDARVELISLAYNVGFAEGVREVQRENGDNIDVTAIQSTDGSQSTTSSQTTTGGSLSAGTNSVSATVSSSESTGESNSRSGSLTTTATVVSGVAAAAADSARLAAARQNIINSESGVIRDVSNARTGTVRMRVDPTKAIDGFIKHGLTLGRITGRLVYDRMRILQ